jgi:hypothetical protein
VTPRCASDPCFTTNPPCFLTQGLLAAELDSNGRRSCLSTLIGVTCIAVGWPQASLCTLSHPFPSRSIPLTSEFTTSLTRPSPAFNAQVHTETSLALLPSCGESLLVDSMCCVASGPSGVFDRGTWVSCNTPVRSKSPHRLLQCSRATSSTCQKPCPIPDGNKAFKA